MSVGDALAEQFELCAERELEWKARAKAAEAKLAKVRELANGALYGGVDPALLFHILDGEA